MSGDPGEFPEFRKTLEERVRELNEKVQELDCVRSAFVSVVSHELRTPMTSIKGYVDNMLDGLTGPLSEKQSYYLERVRFNVDRLTRTINDLLDLSRIEAGRVELSVNDVSLNAMLTEVTDAFKPSAKAKAVLLLIDCSIIETTVPADPYKLRQVLSHLVQNAMKFTPPHGRITLSAEPCPDGAMLFSVSDTGIGVPPHERTKIFERFYRGEAVDVELRGAGLGLAISKSLVELHGGRIWVESEPGEGSRFLFTIPANPEFRLTDRKR